MAGRGRGRGRTLPAWMQQQQGGGPAPGGGEPALGGPNARGGVPGGVPGGLSNPPAAKPPGGAANPRDLWSEHRAPSGRPYWYNKETQQSVWVKPAELMTDAERSAAKQNVWKEYSTPEGKKYYYNTETKVTSWNPPPGFQPTPATTGNAPASQPSRGGNAAPSGAAAGAPQARPADSSSTHTRLPDTGTGAMIRPRAGGAGPESFPAQRAPQPQQQQPVNGRPAGNATRASVEDKNRFRELLRSRADIDLYAQWRKVLPTIEDHDAAKGLSKLELLEVFDDYMNELNKADQESQHKKKQERRRQERQNRDAFNAMLRKHRSEGSIDALTRWRDYAKSVKDDPVFIAVLEQSGSTPRELFEDYIEHLEDELEPFKTVYRRLCRDLNWTMKPDTTKDMLKDHLAQAKDSVISEDIIDILFRHYHGRAVDDHQREISRKRKAINRFIDLLHDTPGIDATTAWPTIERRIRDRSAYRGISSAEDREKIFNMFIKNLASSNSGEGATATAPADRAREGSATGTGEDGAGGAGDGDKRRRRSESGSGDDRSGDREHKRRRRHRRD